MDPMIYTLQLVHKFVGIPYAWSGKNANWAAEANGAGFKCSTGASPVSGGLDGTVQEQCRCFLEYMVAQNRTADGLWFCSNTNGEKYNNMLRHVMPGAKWFTTLRDPWHHALATYKMFVKPMQRTDIVPMSADACEYSGLLADGTDANARLGLLCFINKMADPTLRHCSSDEGLSTQTSQLCALGFGSKFTGEQAEQRYVVLPAEDPITPFLGAMLLQWNISKSVVRQVHNSLSYKCLSGDALSVDVHMVTPPTDEVTDGVDQGALTKKRREFASASVEVGRLHQKALHDTSHLKEHLRQSMNLETDHSACWDKLFEPAMNALTEDGTALPAELERHTDAERWTIFDNANSMFQIVRLDQCVRGLPSNLNVVSHMGDDLPATTDAAANSLLSSWLRTMREHASPSECINSTGFNIDLSGPYLGDNTVSESYKLAFKGAAKVASMTGTKWMQCRFDAHEGGMTLPDFKHIHFVREPTKRFISGFSQMTMHYLKLLRLSPDQLKQCEEAWPNDLDMVKHSSSIKDPNGPWPHFCREAWTLDAYSRLPLNPGSIMELTLDDLRAARKSTLFNALWKLPGSCRKLVFHVNATSFLTHELCEGADCEGECELSDETLAGLLAHALSDSAKTVQIGCGHGLFGGEHLWPMHLHLFESGRADVVMRLESLEEDAKRFDAYLAEQLGHDLPPPKEECSFDHLHENNGVELQKALIDTDRLFDILQRSPDLQHRLCAFYYHDFVCAGYKLPDACSGPTDQWLSAAFDRLQADSPVAPLESAKKQKAGSGHDGESPVLHKMLMMSL